MLGWIHNKLCDGFYFPFLVKLLSVLEKLSLNYWAKRFVKSRGYTDESGKKPPRWVSELLQFFFIVLAIIVLSTIDSIGTTRWLIVVVVVLFSYRLAEIIVFTLNWIFVHEVKVHLYRRSIAGFLLNLFEIALYVAIIGTLRGCLLEPAGGCELVYTHLVGIFTLSPAVLDTSCYACQALSTVELFASLLLLLVVLAGLVGEILRGEVGDGK